MILTVQKYSFLSVYANYFCQFAQLFSEYGRYCRCGSFVYAKRNLYNSKKYTTFAAEISCNVLYADH